jgi:hypothetical protein
MVPLPCRHHTDRVKKFVTEPDNPWLLISAAEDGTGNPPFPCCLAVFRAFIAAKTKLIL